MKAKREHGLTQSERQRCLILLTRWKSYVRKWAELGYAPSVRQTQELWQLYTTSSVSYVLQQLANAGLIHKPPMNIKRGYMPNAEIVETGGKRYAVTLY